jgi:peptidoglycan hydrolase-like protein with peptidoglycan-binding domain
MFYTELMRKLAILLLALLAIAGVSSARTHRKSNKIARPAQRSRRATAPRSKRAMPRYSKRSRTRRTASTQPAPRPQPGPTPERYKEIQQALADKGYYKGEVNGQWTAESTEALSRFQSDQNLKVDGKLGSLSLIALGLGPKRTANAQAKPAQPASDSPPPEPGVPE